MTNLPRTLRLPLRGTVALALLAITAPLASAQAPGRPAPPREIRGTIQSVDAKARTLTVLASDGRTPPVEKTFKLAKDAEIAIGTGSQPRGIFKPGKLDDLGEGTIVIMTPAEGSDDTVTGVAANGPMMRGRLKSVDAAKKTITATMFSFAAPSPEPVEKTFTLADDVEIGIDDGRGRRFSIREGKLADLVEGSGLTLQISPDGKEVQSVVAEGPTLVGTVLENAADQRRLTLRAGPTMPGDAPGERTLEVADDAIVALDDGRGRRLSLTAGKLADVPAGSSVTVRLSGDGKQAVYVSASGPQAGGLIKEVDAAKRTIKIAILTARGREPEEKTLEVAADARIIVDNAPAGLDAVKPGENGPFVNVRLSLDQKTVRAITVNQNR